MTIYVAVVIALHICASSIKQYNVEPKFWLIKFDEVLGNEIKQKLRQVFKVMFQLVLYISRSLLGVDYQSSS